MTVNRNEANDIDCVTLIPRKLVASNHPPFPAIYRVEREILAQFNWRSTVYVLDLEPPTGGHTMGVGVVWS